MLAKLQTNVSRFANTLKQMVLPAVKWITTTGGGLVRSVVQWLTRVVQWFKANHLLKHALLVVVLIIGIMYLSRSFGAYVEGITSDWVQHLPGEEVEALEFPAGSPIAAPEQARLQGLFDTVRERRDLHLKVMNFYYARFFTSIIMLSLLGGLAAILLLLIGKDGWKNTEWTSGKGLIVTAFVIVTAAAVYYNSWPGVFKQEQNIGDNKILLLQYLALENEMLSYAITNEALNYAVSVEDLHNQAQATAVVTSTTVLSGTAAIATNNPQQSLRTIGRPMSPKEFIHYVDLRLAKDNVAIGFDYNQVPNYENIFGAQ